MIILRFSAKLGLLILAIIILATGSLLVTRQQSNISETGKTLLAGSVQQISAMAQGISVPGLPVRLKIPKLAVNSSIEGLGLTEEGDMDAPEAIDIAGWYNAGPRPGDIGSAVVDGHFGILGNKPAIFDSLHTLNKGDLIYVEDRDGNTHTFIVSRTRLFQPDDDASEVFHSDDDKSHLNLITCQGTWNENKESYSERLVVFADLLVD